MPVPARIRHNGTHACTTISRGVEALRAALDAAIAVAKADSANATPYGWVEDPDWGFVVVFDGYQNYTKPDVNVTIHQLWAVGGLYNLATRAEQWLQELKPDTWEHYAGPRLRVDGQNAKGFTLDYVVNYDNPRYGIQTVTIAPTWIFVSK